MGPIVDTNVAPSYGMNLVIADRLDLSPADDGR